MAPAILMLLLAITSAYVLPEGSSRSGNDSTSNNLGSGIISPPPDRDYVGLAQRLGSKKPATPTPLHPQYVLGHRQTFWAMDLVGTQRFTLNAELVYISPHAYFYVEDGVEIPQEALAKAAADFEERIYPSLIFYAGQPWGSGVDGDTRLVIINARIPGVAGYYSSTDEYPRWVNPYSNQRKSVYMNVNVMSPGTEGYGAVLAHELQHVIHGTADPNEESWVNEGLSEVAVKLAGYQPSLYYYFLASPDTSLTGWRGLPSPANYGASYLFLEYLLEHYGGLESFGDLLAQPGDGAAGIEDYLRSKGFAKGFDGVFDDWVAASYVEALGEGTYSYPDTQLEKPATHTISGYGTYEEDVHQYAADYYELALAGDATITFKGQETTPILPTTPRSGSRFWWGNQGDNIDATLTREFDLSRLTKATLRFWLWYDIEEGWDQAYLEASPDQGETWVLLRGPHTTSDDPAGTAFGPAYTGMSGRDGPEWVEEVIDLSPFARGKVTLRFEYVTDEATNHAGIAIDDIQIPELGFGDDAEGDAGWEALGFVRTDNTLSQSFSVQVIEHGPETAVRQMALDSQNWGSLTVRGMGPSQKVAIVVAAKTLIASSAARYQLTIAP